MPPSNRKLYFYDSLIHNRPIGITQMYGQTIGHLPNGTLLGNQLLLHSGIFSKETGGVEKGSIKSLGTP